MKELLQTSDIVLISALRASLAARGIELFEFDAPIAGLLPGIANFPRRLYVCDEDYEPALRLARDMCPEEIA
jgi:hypothetical protein